MMRPNFPPRPMPQMGVVPIQRPPIIPGIRGAPPMVAPPVRPPVPAVTPVDKPPTAVYVGKIAPTVDNDFILSLLRVYLYFPVISRLYMEVLTSAYFIQLFCLCLHRCNQLLVLCV
jgi:hypothetical protein